MQHPERYKECLGFCSYLFYAFMPVLLEIQLYIRTYLHTLLVIHTFLYTAITIFYRQWVSQGIETKEVLDLGSYSFQVTCESSHLTAFAVIVDTSQVKKYKNVLELLQTFS